MPTPPNPADVAYLSVQYPIALLPVRIETRFVTTTDPTQDWLLIRVYPDEICARHRDPLTSDEWAAGVAFWQEAWDSAHQLDAWRRLVHGRSSARAAAIVRVTSPANLVARPVGTPSWEGLSIPSDPGSTAYTDVLPDCWEAIAYRGGTESHNVVYRVVGGPIVEPLALSFTPDATTLSNYHGLELEADVRWMLDFDEAVDAGMAMRMPLVSGDLTTGFDRLVVLGVKAAIGPVESAGRLSALLEGHHYGRGLSIVPQGTPTNNSSEGASGYPSQQDPDQSYAIELGLPLATDGTDGARLDAALGLPTDSAGTRVFDHVEGADRIEQTRARAMAYALWPCTLGYFLEQLATPLLDDDGIATVRQHFVDYVRGRGPLPAFRVGNVPYGVLPMTTLRTHQNERNVYLIEDKFRRMLAYWNEAFLNPNVLSGVARVGASNDADADLLGVLKLDASCREVRLREFLGPAYARAFSRLFGVENFSSLESAWTWSAVAALTLAGVATDPLPRLSGLIFADTALRVGQPFVTAAPLSETDPLPPDGNYIATIGDTATSIETLQGLGQGSADPLLLHLLRQAVLVEYARLSVSLAFENDDASEVDRREVEFFRIAPGTTDRKTPWTRFAETPTYTNGMTIGDWLRDTPESPASQQADAKALRDALHALELVPTAELERLLTETLDVCSHRLDAWIISHATRQLSAMRENHPTGIHLGAYAFVENLRPRSAAASTAGGFIHAPSATHATAAAILRNAYLTRPSPARDDFAIDLSSERVRRALRLLDGVRHGQPLGALLGYAFERALHDRSLDQYIAPFRASFPISRDAAGAARDVVNGLALRDAVFQQPNVPWNVLSFVTTPDHDAVAACLGRLEEDVDSVADLLMAESVYQVAQGNMDRGAANLATLAGNGSVPAPQVVTVPRSGLNFTHRVAIILGSLATGSPWPTGTPRQTAEPRLEAWLGALLGAPSSIACRVLHPDAQDPETTVESTVTAQDLGIAALDFYAMSQRAAGEALGELDARIRWCARSLPQPTEVVYARAAGAGLETLTFPEAVEVARVVSEFVGAARPLTAEDLIPPGQSVEAIATDLLGSRADDVNTAFEGVRSILSDALDVAQGATPPETFADLRAALWSATLFGVREAVPVNFDAEDAAAHAALVAQATSVATELARRHDTYEAATGGLDQLRALLGPETPILPTFNPANRADLLTAAQTSPIGNAPFAARLWFDRVARVRPSVGRLRTVAVTTEATAGAALPLEVVQLPHVDGAPWIGGEMPRDSSEPRPAAGTLSLVAHVRDADSLESESWAGIAIDEWAEHVPSDTQLTSIAFHHDAPGAEAPQCVVLAVPAPTATTWDLEALEDIVNQTLDTAKLRAVDAERLSQYMLLTPTIYLAANVADDTVSSPLGAARVEDTHILAPE